MTNQRFVGNLSLSRLSDVHRAIGKLLYRLKQYEEFESEDLKKVWVETVKSELETIYLLSYRSVK